MCGICGKLNFDSQQDVDQALLQRMMALLAHRGPDGDGEYRSGPIALGHRRLSIIDLDTGAQPISNEDGTVWVVYNGEIYNFLELRADLIKRGHQFKSATDTEVIVHSYEEWGDQCVSRFQGMFAFALWDSRGRRLLLARDRVGVKPLYFANIGKALVFASEIKALLADPAVSRRVNTRCIDRFLTYYFLPGNETLFEGILKLEPGHYLTAENGRIAVQQYWDLRFEALSGEVTFDDAVVTLQEKLSRVVKGHMISDVPVGVLLSGGVDSTGVLSYAAKHSQVPLHTFTVGFAGADFADERPYARLASERFGTIHQEISMSAEDFRDILPKYVWHMEEPVCEPPALALHVVARLARNSSVKVLLSGEGGDEAFGGYQTYRNLLFLERLKSALGPARGLLRPMFTGLGRIGFNRVGPYANLVEPSLAAYYFSRSASPSTPFNRLKGELYVNDFAATLAGESSDAPTRKLFDRVTGQSSLNQMLYVDTKSWLPDDLLVKADKMTMAASVELRVPLLDPEILEFAASLPQSYKVRGWTLKRVLKAALEDVVPRQIIKRTKTGFPVPYAQWMRDDLRDFVSDTIQSAMGDLSSYFRPAAVSKILQANARGEGYSKEVFSLLVLALWHQQFMHSPQPS